MPNYNPDTGIPYGVIAVNSLNQDWIWDEINDMESPELDYAYRDAARDAAAYLLAKGEIDINDLPEGCEEGDEYYAIGDMTDWQVIDLVESVIPDFGQSFYDGIDEGEFRKHGEIDGVRVSVASLGGASLLWVEYSPFIGKYSPCSPCVPGAGDLDSPDPDGIECYDVPPDWRAS